MLKYSTEFLACCYLLYCLSVYVITCTCLNRTITVLVNVIRTVMKQFKQLQGKPRKKIGDSNGIQTHVLRDTGAMLYQLSYEAC